MRAGGAAVKVAWQGRARVAGLCLAWDPYWRGPAGALLAGETQPEERGWSDG